MAQLTYGSLFSGVGGIDLGLDRAGFHCEWQVEIDEYASKVLAKHWPHVARYGDVRDCGSHNLKAVDLLCGGFPCQPHSLAGKRQASSDERDLWGEFSRVICELRPAWVLAENVPGVLSSENGRFFGRVLSDLAQSGYDAEWQTLPAAAFGAPHLRERVFLVAYPQGARGRQEYRSLSTYAEDAQGWPTVRNIQPQHCSQDVPDPDRQSLAVGQVFGSHARQELASFKRDCSEGTGQWATEPDVGRVAHGVSSRMDRLRGLGNAVVPQVAEYIGRCIMNSYVK